MQPDQDPALWDRHVRAYETAFEHLTDAFARQALSLLGPLRDLALLDVAAGTGGAALRAAQDGAQVTAIDASPAMIERVRERARLAGNGVIVADVQDGMALALPDAVFDAALSSFGVVLFPDPARGVAELYRVLRPGGRLAIVTWTEPHRFELGSRLRDAVIAVRGTPPVGDPPAQLRFADPDRLRALLTEGGFTGVRIERATAELTARSAHDLAGSLAFAPGMAAMLDGFGRERDKIIEAFTARLVADQGDGAISLAVVAHIAVACRR